VGLTSWSNPGRIDGGITTARGIRKGGKVATREKGKWTGELSNLGGLAEIRQPSLTIKKTKVGKVIQKRGGWCVRDLYIPSNIGP